MAKKKPSFKINSDKSGSVLKDFATLLDFVAEEKYPVGKKGLQFSGKALIDLNLRFSQPIKHTFKRPTQASFHHINLLYQAASDLVFFSYTETAKNTIIQLNDDAIASWKKLNTTEKYFTLFEMCNTDTEGMFSSVSYKIRSSVERYFQKGKTEIDADTNRQLQLSRRLPSIALMQLFGLCNVEQGEADAKGRWNIVSLEKTPLADILLSDVESFDYYINEQADKVGWDNLLAGWSKSLFSPLFPDYKKHYQLEATKQSYTEGDYVFRISLGRAWRQVALNHHNTLSTLADSILRYFDFDNDHLHEFSFSDTTGRKRKYSHYNVAADNDEKSSEDITLGELPLGLKSSMIFLFDFGDDWRFKVTLEDILTPSSIEDGVTELLNEGGGKAPEQYPQWNED